MTIDTLLGQNISTATHTLRINVMHSMADRLGLLECPKCDSRIESARDLSIDHIDPWRGVSAELFWDLDNIQFTHKWCNKTDRPGRKLGPDGTAWCSDHKQFLPESSFNSNVQRWNNLHRICRECDKVRNKKYASRNPRFACPECKAQMRKKCSSCGYDIGDAAYKAMRRREQKDD